MGSGVVSIRVEALGVSITIADGNIAIEQTGIPAATPKAETVTASSEVSPARARQIPAQPAQPAQLIAEYVRQPPEEDAAREDSGTSVIDESHRAPDRPQSNGYDGPRQAQSGQTKFGWSDEEVEQLKALYPTHSASVIARRLGRRVNAVKSKAQHLKLKKGGPTSSCAFAAADFSCLPPSWP